LTFDPYAYDHVNFADNRVASVSAGAHDLNHFTDNFMSGDTERSDKRSPSSALQDVTVRHDQHEKVSDESDTPV
jgi:hypothetical protein